MLCGGLLQLSLALVSIVLLSWLLSLRFVLDIAAFAGLANGYALRMQWAANVPRYVHCRIRPAQADCPEWFPFILYRPTFETTMHFSVSHSLSSPHR